MKEHSILSDSKLVDFKQNKCELGVGNLSKIKSRKRKVGPFYKIKLPCDV
jgi:hypothetical protein